MGLLERIQKIKGLEKTVKIHVICVVSRSKNRVEGNIALTYTKDRGHILVIYRVTEDAAVSYAINFCSLSCRSD